MSLAIHALQRAASDSRAIEEFLATNTFPIVEGRTVTFVFRGEADRVELVHWVYGLESSQEFQRIRGTDLWYFVMELPDESRVEYKFGVTVGTESRLLRDELNENSARDPYGANSVVHGAGYESPEWVQEHGDARRGTLHERVIASRVFGDRRDVQVYLPARYRPSRRYPLLIVHDGADYLRFAALRIVLDNLIERFEVAPLIVAMTQSPDRMNEYAADARHARFLVEELVPTLESEYPLLPEPESRGLMGASFGAVAALSTAWLHPGVFGRLFLQSGSFVFTDIGTHDRPPVFDPIVEFTNEFRRTPGRPSDAVFVSCGQYESLVYYNRSLIPLLQSTGMDVRFREVPDGHNWENWRDRLREGLTYLFPGPLWLVYE